MYTIETKTAQQDLTFLILGNRRTLSNGEKTFALMVLKDRTNTPIPQNGFELGEVSLSVKPSFKKDATYNTLTDELGNIYIDVTSYV
jgi:hypothetical protein